MRTLTKCVHLSLLFLIAGLIEGGFQRSLSAQDPPSSKAAKKTARVLFLHHSTGESIWNGGVQDWLEQYNRQHGVNYSILEQSFPKESPYGWENFPFDYWNIWVKHAGLKKYKDEPTLEILAKQYDVIMLKHCFPVSNVEEDTGRGNVESNEKRAENYQLQYAALKKKFHEFPNVKFIVWTGAALLKSETNEESASRASSFFYWVRTEWDQPGDNIYVWDFWTLETGGGLYLKQEHAAGDSHPSEAFAKRVAPLLGKRVVDVIEGRGDIGSLTGEAPSALAMKSQHPDEQTADTATTPKQVVTDKASRNAQATMILDDAEVPSRQKGLWGEQVKYIKVQGGSVLQLLFASAKEEDWGEYGQQRVISTLMPKKNYDIRRYGYLTLRMQADREAEVVLSLLTLPDLAAPRDQPQVKFNAYLHSTKNTWKTLTFDLSKMEIGVEGEGALEKAGSPSRPNDLTMIQFSINSKLAEAKILIDDLSLLETLPERLKETLQEP